MKYFMRYKALFLTFVLVAMVGCGSDGQLVLSPEGPTAVEKGQTLQFTSNQPGTSYTVEGGAANGTIDSNGLYTPPTTLPINPQITVTGTANGDTDSVLVNLKTADALAFGTTPATINDVSLPGLTAVAELLIAGNGDRLGVRVGSIQIDSVWTGLNTVDPSRGNVFYSQNVNFLGFDPASNLTNSSTSSQVPTSVVTNSQLNPEFVYADDDNGAGGTGPRRLKFKGSSDHGDTFGINSSVDTSNPTANQLQGILNLDADDDLHVAFVREVSGNSQIAYATSGDDGATWATAVPIGLPAPASSQIFPYIAVSGDGGHIYVCWNDDEDTASNNDIYFSSSTNGTTFSTPKALTNSGQGGACRVAIGKNGEVYVAYSEDDDSDNFYDVFLAKSEDGGANFDSAVTVNSDLTNLDSFLLPNLSVDSEGRLDVVWSSDTDNNGDIDSLMYARSIDEGATFSANVPVAGSAAVTVIIPTGMRHDISGRLHLQFISDVNDPGSSYNVFYLMAE